MDPKSTPGEKDFQIAQILSGKSNRYQIQKFLGEGVYGKVAQCTQLKSNEKMAVKIVHKRYPGIGENESEILEELKKLDVNKNNLVKFVEDFIYQGYFCLVFEMLDISLFDLMVKRFPMPLCVSEVRVITQQMLVALNALKSIGVTHADIKLDNIMLVNHRSQPFKIKLIDFGMAHPASKIWLGSKIQAIRYRAPEVMLGLPFNEAIDMWSVGCVMALLFLGRHLYPKDCEYEKMRIIVKMQGQPNDDMLHLGIYSRDFFRDCFREDFDSSSPSWRLKTLNEYHISTGCIVKPCSSIYEKFASLDDIATTCQGDKDGTEYKDTQAFLSLLKRMLHLDPEKRINPSEALGHRFITLKHFPCDTYNSYVESSTSTIKNCKLEQSSFEFQRFVTSSEVVSLNGESRNLNDPLSVDEVMAAGNNNEPPATAGLDETTAVGTKKKPPGTNEAASPASVNHNSHELNTGSDDDKKGFVEVKTRKKPLKRI